MKQFFKILGLLLFLTTGMDLDVNADIKDIMNAYNKVLIVKHRYKDYNISSRLASTFKEKGFKIIVSEYENEYEKMTEEELETTIICSYDFQLNYGSPSTLVVTLRDPIRMKREDGFWSGFITFIYGDGQSYTPKGDAKMAVDMAANNIDIMLRDYKYDNEETVKMRKRRIENFADTIQTVLKKEHLERGLDPIEGVYKSLTPIYWGITKFAIHKNTESNKYMVWALESEDLDVFYNPILYAQIEFVSDGRYTITLEDNLLRWWFISGNRPQSRNGLVEKKDGNLTLSFDGREYLSVKTYPMEADSGIEAARPNHETKCTGSGFFVSERIIATNNHVVKDANKIEIEIKNATSIETYEGKVLTTDETNDLALVSISDKNFSGARDIPYSIDAKNVSSGVSVFSMGYPLCGLLGNEVKITEGIISSKTGYKGDATSFQISAPIQPGNSGGPLFETDGHLIGITNAGVTGTDNVGYAIKTTFLCNLIDASPVLIETPKGKDLTGKNLSELVKMISPYVVLVKVY